MSSSVPSLFNAAQFNAALFGGQPAPSGPIVQVGHGLLYPALRKANITIGPQRTPSSAQFQDAIEELNRLTASLGCDRLFIYALDILELPLEPAKKEYTIGHDPTGTVVADWDVPRPLAITMANVITSDGTGPLRSPVALATPQVWAWMRVSIALQELPNTIPSTLYYNRAYPIATISLFGQPMTGMTLELYTWHQVQNFGALTDVVLLPPGYEDCMVLNLACRLAPHFQRVINPDVQVQARESLMRVLSLNAPRPIAATNALGCSGDYDINSDTWRG